MNAVSQVSTPRQIAFGLGGEILLMVVLGGLWLSTGHTAMRVWVPLTGILWIQALAAAVALLYRRFGRQPIARPWAVALGLLGMALFLTWSAVLA